MNITPVGKTYLYDAIFQAIKIAERKNNFKNTQYIICTTDGDDSGSKCTL